MLGLKIIGGGRTSTYISVPNRGRGISWCCRGRSGLSLCGESIYFEVATAEEVEDAHKEFWPKAKSGVTELRELQTNGKAHFLLSDISKNWWEITS